MHAYYVIDVIYQCSRLDGFPKEVIVPVQIDFPEAIVHPPFPTIIYNPRRIARRVYVRPSKR